MSITLKMVHTGFLVSKERLRRLCDDQNCELTMAVPAQFQTKCERSRIESLPERFTNITPAKTGNTITMLTLTLVSANDWINTVSNASRVLTKHRTFGPPEEAQRPTRGIDERGLDHVGHHHR